LGGGGRVEPRMRMGEAQMSRTDGTAGRPRPGCGPAAVGAGVT